MSLHVPMQQQEATWRSSNGRGPMAVSGMRIRVPMQVLEAIWRFWSGPGPTLRVMECGNMFYAAHGGHLEVLK